MGGIKSAESVNKLLDRGLRRLISNHWRHLTIDTVGISSREEPSGTTLGVVGAVVVAVAEIWIRMP